MYQELQAGLPSALLHWCEKSDGTNGGRDAIRNPDMRSPTKHGRGERVVVVRGTRQVSEIIVLSIDGGCGRLGNWSQARKAPRPHGPMGPSYTLGRGLIACQTSFNTCHEVSHVQAIILICQLVDVQRQDSVFRPPSISPHRELCGLTDCILLCVVCFLP